ncbi:hypothetical protein ABZ801_34445 [Actinomadura sp. NPDC047616]|uniref:hypothetical protein n=1 Tax=Actinomadura sp. NPDC047616 TaxID=3155914 RepID=UPI003402E1D4
MALVSSVVGGLGMEAAFCLKLISSPLTEDIRRYGGHGTPSRGAAPNTEEADRRLHDHGQGAFGPMSVVAPVPGGADDDVGAAQDGVDSGVNGPSCAGKQRRDSQDMRNPRHRVGPAVVAGRVGADHLQPPVRTGAGRSQVSGAHAGVA